jgi:hypothetical protein
MRMSRSRWRPPSMCLVLQYIRANILSAYSVDDDDEIVAHLLPCGHDLHNACLKPWVERANSCPICRAKFNSIDPSMIMQDELFSVEVWEPCIVCGTSDQSHSSQMYCDGCDKAVHIFCAGYDDAPEVWYCESCLVDIESDAALPGLPAAVRRRPRQRPRQRNAPAGRRLGRTHDTSWARVWQEVSQRLDLDLDFPFDDEEATRDTRTPQQRREFQQWQRRFEVADRQGVTNRLRDIATRTHPSQPAPAPESQEELRAWNAFDKARELHEPNARKRKASSSPASPQEPEPEPKKLKRPRLRRPAANAGSPPAESSRAATQRAAEGTTFLSSLLREVENNPSSAGSPGPSSAQYSPRNSSPARSPGSSGYGSPNAASATPPMSPVAHPSSPAIPLFSPFSPAVASQDLERPSRPRPRGRRQDQHDSGYDENYHSGLDALSPSRNMSYSAKEEIQRMVKMALRPRYLDKTINKDQYTDINRDVSRKMYDLVGDVSQLADQGARERWQGMAAEEVQKAVTSLLAEAPSRTLVQGTSSVA